MRPTDRITSASFRSVRPLVRYVDEAQAVLDIHLRFEYASTKAQRRDRKSRQARTVTAHVWVRLEDAEGARTERLLKVIARNGKAMVRCDFVRPKRWWPAGMGDQSLYDMTVALLCDDQLLDTWQTTIGLTSVRPTHRPRRGRLTSIDESEHEALLVNGRRRLIHDVVPVRPEDEGQVLPASGDALLLVRDHYGPDVLFDAADRAGLLVVQSITARDTRRPKRGDVAPQVDRLAGHPSLAGWLIDAPRADAERLAGRLYRIDPTRSVFHRCSEAG